MPEPLAQKLDRAIACHQVCFHIQSRHEDTARIRWEIKVFDRARRNLLNSFTGLTIEGAVDQAIAFIESPQLKEGGD